MNVEEIKAEYENRFIAVLEKFNKNVDNPDPDGIMDWCDEEYGWSFNAGPGNYFVILELLEEAIREGDGKGLALSLSVLGKDGIVLSAWSPYNYTNKLWCHTKKQFEKRVQMLEELPDYLIRDIINHK